jgi:hypothetical protein
MKLALYVVARKSIQLGPLGQVSQFAYPFILHWSLTGLTSPTSIRWPYISTPPPKDDRELTGTLGFQTDSQHWAVHRLHRSRSACTNLHCDNQRRHQQTTTKSPIPLPRAETEPIYAQDKHMPHTLPRRPRTCARSRRRRSDCGRHERQHER